MLIEAVDHPIRYRFPGGEIRLEPGQPVEVEPERAAKLLARAGAKVRAVDALSSDVMLEPTGPTTPLQPGWLVAYRDRRGVLCGGCEDRAHGTVGACRWEGKAWMVTLTDGQRLPLPAIQSVGQTDPTGHLVAAWTVRAHGLDGQRDSSDTNLDRNLTGLERSSTSWRHTNFVLSTGSVLRRLRRRSACRRVRSMRPCIDSMT